MEKQKTAQHQGNYAWSMEISPEDASTEVLYAFTFNPKEQPDLMKCNGLALFISHQHKLFNQLHNSRLEMFAEVSRLGRWHFHGTIRFTYVMGFYNYDIHKLMAHGTFKIATIQDMSVWIEYCTKQKRVCEPFVDKNGREGTYHYITPGDLQ